MACRKCLSYPFDELVESSNYILVELARSSLTTRTIVGVVFSRPQGEYLEYLNLAADGASSKNLYNDKKFRYKTSLNS